MRRTEVKIPDYDFLDVHDALTLLGSCFSEHIAESTGKLGFDVLSNPFGVVFNPISLANQLNFTISDWKSTVFQDDDKFLSWNASSLMWALDRKKIESKISELRDHLYQHLHKSTVLFVTFGTAWIYELEKDAGIVANCHKQPQNEFKKKCLTSEEIVSEWIKTLNYLASINPELKVVFTVSPVRHKKDGLVENNLSKSKLLSAVHELVSGHKNSFYFPSYELIVDELRDYAYYEMDGVHPNQYAIAEVENRFLQSFLSREASSTIAEFMAIKSLASHNLLHKGSLSAKKHELSVRAKIEDFLSKHPGFEYFLK